jgi:hypothetical protein
MASTRLDMNRITHGDQRVEPEPKKDLAETPGTSTAEFAHQCENNRCHADETICLIPGDTVWENRMYLAKRGWPVW